MSQCIIDEVVTSLQQQNEIPKKNFLLNIKEAFKALCFQFSFAYEFPLRSFQLFYVFILRNGTQFINRLWI